MNLAVGGSSRLAFFRWIRHGILLPLLVKASDNCRAKSIKPAFRCQRILLLPEGVRARRTKKARSSASGSRNMIFTTCQVLLPGVPPTPGSAREKRLTARSCPVPGPAFFRGTEKISGTRGGERPVQEKGRSGIPASFPLPGPGSDSTGKSPSSRHTPSRFFP